jgi:ABC-type transport system involved in multi-copper enzyme maturation permease subunit
MKVIASALLGTLAVGFVVSILAREITAAHVAGLGFGKDIGVHLADYMLSNLLRSLGFAAFGVAGVFALARKKSATLLARLIVLAMIAAAVLDLAAVDKRYIVPIDVSADYRSYLLGVMRGVKPAFPQPDVRWENLLSLVCGGAVLIWGVWYKMRKGLNDAH